MFRIELCYIIIVGVLQIKVDVNSQRNHSKTEKLCFQSIFLLVRANLLVAIEFVIH
jgi:hypothetical protein